MSRNILWMFWALCVLNIVIVLGGATSAYARNRQHGHSHNHRHVAHHAATTVAIPRTEEDSQACLVRAILMESRGVKREDARITIGRLILSRRGKKQFSTTTCGVIHEHQVNHRTGRTVYEFSWVKKRPHVKLSSDDYDKAIHIAYEAQRLHQLYGPIKYLYFSSNGVCPVPAKSRITKGPFTFCEPRRVT